MLLASGEEQAIDRFKLGLSHLKSGLTMNPALGEELSPMFGPTQDRSKKNSAILLIPVAVACPGNLDEQFYLYKNAFTVKNIPSGQEGDAASRLINVDLLSAIMIYNMALCVSLRSMRTNSSNMQERSLRLYEMCLGLLHTIHRRNGGEEDTGGYVLLYAACSNNVAQVAYQLCDYERSRLMMSSLQNLINVTLNEKRRRHEQDASSTADYDDLSPAAASSCLLGDDDIQGFTLNIMCSYPPTTARAA